MKPPFKMPKILAFIALGCFIAQAIVYEAAVYGSGLSLICEATLRKPSSYTRFLQSISETRTGDTDFRTAYQEFDEALTLFANSDPQKGEAWDEITSEALDWLFWELKRQARLHADTLKQQAAKLKQQANKLKQQANKLKQQANELEAPKGVPVAHWNILLKTAILEEGGRGYPAFFTHLLENVGLFILECRQKLLQYMDLSRFSLAMEKGLIDLSLVGKPSSSRKTHFLGLRRGTLTLEEVAKKDRKPLPRFAVYWVGEDFQKYLPEIVKQHNAVRSRYEVGDLESFYNFPLLAFHASPLEDSRLLQWFLFWQMVEGKEIPKEAHFPVLVFDK